jgi:hypothetical protein
MRQLHRGDRIDTIHALRTLVRRSVVTPSANRPAQLAIGIAAVFWRSLHVGHDDDVGERLLTVRRPSAATL